MALQPSTSFIGDLAEGLSAGYIQGTKMEMEKKRLTEEIRNQQALTTWRMRQLEQEKAKMQQEGQIATMRDITDRRGQDITSADSRSRIQESADALRESIRHNKASEGLQSQQITSTNDFRQDQLTERAINLRTRIGTSISSRLEKLRSSYANGFAPAEQQQAAIEEAISAEEANMKLLKMTPQEVESVIAPFKANIQKAYDEEAVAGGEKEIVTEKHSWMPDSTKKIETPEELVTALDQGVFGNPKSPTTFIKAATYARIYEIALTEKAKDALKAKAEAAKQPIN